MPAELTAEHLEGQTIGPWHLQERIGEGASAVVYRSQRGDQSVAVKVFRPEVINGFGQSQHIHRIERQRELIGVDHPYLIKIIDGEKCPQTGLWYLVMEYLDHEPLDKHRIPRNRIRPLLAQVAEAARFLDGRRIAHRDIKPSNIVVSPDFRKATLLDLGVVAGSTPPTEDSFVRSLSERYIAGVVVLHGTDTMAYSATALTVGMQHIPCPVVLTGSNQPPDEDSIGERSIIQSRSDAWRNLVTSIYFLHCFGHRFTESFLCFNDSIFHAVNLRKSAIERIPMKVDPHLRALEEPYTFRNVALHRQYMFRLIDGVFCNNFYPISSEKNYRVLVQQSGEDFRHVRKSVWKCDRQTRIDPFTSDQVFLIKASPSIARTNPRGELGPFDAPHVADREASRARAPHRAGRGLLG